MAKTPKMQFRSIDEVKELLKTSAPVSRKEQAKRERAKREQAERAEFTSDARGAGFSDAQLRFLEKWFSMKGHTHPKPIELMRY